MIGRSCGTHDGTFHADEVTACSLLVLFNRIDRDKIVRTRDLSQLKLCEYVCDVGGTYEPAKKRFDHHQVEYQGELSSAGMVLSYLQQERVIDKKMYDYLNLALVKGIDAHDNGKFTPEPGVMTFSQIITLFVPANYEVPSSLVDGAFFSALDFTVSHLKRMVERYQYVEECRQAVIEAMKTNEKFLSFEKPLPWMDVFFEKGGEEHPALFILMPSGEHWKVRGIPPTSKDRMQVRQPLPAAWAGLMGEELKAVSGISGAIFCHKGRFISVWETKEAALQALKMVLT